MTHNLTHKSGNEYKNKTALISECYTMHFSNDIKYSHLLTDTYKQTKLSLKHTTKNYLFIDIISNILSSCILTSKTHTDIKALSCIIYRPNR